MNTDKPMTPGQREQRQPYRMRIPGFVSEKEIGLGDIVSRAAVATGLRPCGGCIRRTESLNRLLALSPRRGK
jgi:hypothetical protein